MACDRGFVEIIAEGMLWRAGGQLGQVQVISLILTRT